MSDIPTERGQGRYQLSLSPFEAFLPEFTIHTERRKCVNKILMSC